jgi:TP901 family phage tail tape measure protein
MAAETFRIEIPIEVQDKIEPGVSQATKKVSQFDKTIEKTKSKMDEFNKTKFSAVIEAVDKASAVAGRIGTTLKGITGKVWHVTMSVLDKATAPIRGVINLLKNPLIQLGAVIGISVSLKDTIDTFSTFEATMSKVQAVGELTSEQLAVVTAKAKEMGATTKFTATEAGEAFTYMAQAGWTTEQMLAGIDGVLALSAADGLDLASTASIVTDTLAAFGLQASDTAHFADVLAKAAAATNVDVAQMGETFTYVAPIAGAMGYSIEDMSTAIGLMANSAVKGSMAGTALKTAISNMVTPTDEQVELMKKLGVSMTDSKGNANSFMTVMKDLRTGFSKLSETEKTAAASTLFGSYAMSGMLAIINASDESFSSLAESIENSQGTAEQMAEVMLDNLAGSFTLLQSAMDGVKISLGSRLAPYLRQFASWLTNKMPAVEKAIGEAMDFVDEKVKWLKETINDFTSGEEWENADIWEKIKIAWDKIVAEPFSAWWNSTGKAWFAEKAAAIGKGLGSGLKMGLLAILGIDVSKTFDEGQSVGASFIQGFKEGFDTEQITEALKTWAENNKEVVAVLGVVLGGKLIGGIYKGVKEAKSLITDIKNIFSKGASNTAANAMPSAYTTTTMTVTANVVNVYGTSVNNVGQGAKDILTSLGGAAGGAALGAGGAKALLTAGGAAALPAAGTPLLLPGAGGAAAAATAGGLTSATGALGTLLQAGSTSSVIAADGTLLAVTGGVGGTLGSVGGALGTTATTAAGAAAAGVAGGAGIIGGLLGLGSAAIDLFKGIGKSKEGDTKGAKDQYVTAGTKTGMVAAGAGTGALIGSVVPGVGTAIGALVGAGVGGVGALLGGNKAGKALSDATDKDGGLTKLWESIKTGASNAGTWVADKWGETGDWISDKWSGFSDWFDTSVWTPVKDVGISAINIAAGAWSEVRDWIGDKWSDFSGWFGETVWTPVSNAAQVAGQWVSDRWNDARTWVGDRWSDFSGWFEESIWAPVKTGAQAAGEWVSEKWSDAKTWVNETWGTVSDWFSETVWEPVKGAAETAGEWLGTQFDAAWTAVSNAWDGVSGWFEDNVWGPIKSGATEAWNWVGEKLGGIGEWIGDKWTSFKGWLSGLGQKGSKETGLTTSQGKGSVLEHAHGGIMTQPHMGIVAEAGAESIIPLSPSKRTRGIDLWRETGELLGVRPYADGGVVGKIKADDEDMPVATGNNSGGVTIKVEVSANPEITIGTSDTGDDERILSVLKTYIRSMADDIGDELAERLARIFANMPVRA